MLHCSNMVCSLSLSLLDLCHFGHFHIAAMQHKRWRNYRRGPTCQRDGPTTTRAGRIREGRPPHPRPPAPSRPPRASPAGAGLCGDRTHEPAQEHPARLGHAPRVPRRAGRAQRPLGPRARRARPRPRRRRPGRLRGGGTAHRDARRRATAPLPRFGRTLPWCPAGERRRPAADRVLPSCTFGDAP